MLAILFGILLTAWHANEWLKFLVVAEPPFTLATMPEPDCEADELEEEGLSLAECRQLTYAVQDINVSAPAWFRNLHAWLSAIGTILALLSVIAGIALVDQRTWSTRAAVAAFAALVTLDVASFTAVVNTGALMRQMYLWNILLWFFIHVAMLVGATVLHQWRKAIGASPNGASPNE